jgi:hypothetical protein
MMSKMGGGGGATKGLEKRLSAAIAKRVSNEARPAPLFSGPFSPPLAPVPPRQARLSGRGAERRAVVVAGDVCLGDLVAAQQGAARQARGAPPLPPLALVA